MSYIWHTGTDFIKHVENSVIDVKKQNYETFYLKVTIFCHNYTLKTYSETELQQIN
jgi:hypothetical protein